MRSTAYVGDQGERGTEGDQVPLAEEPGEPDGKAGTEFPVRQADIKTAKAYQFNLAIQRTWELPPQAARRCLRKWIAWAERCNMPEMTKLAKSVREHLNGIVESVRQRVTSGYAEGLNNKIRTAFRYAYGFKAKECRDTMIYLVAGGLSLLIQC